MKLYEPILVVKSNHFKIIFQARTFKKTMISKYHILCGLCQFYVPYCLLPGDDHIIPIDDLDTPIDDYFLPERIMC